MDLLKRLEQHVDAFKKIAALPPGERGSHSKAVWREWARDVEAAVSVLRDLPSTNKRKDAGCDCYAIMAADETRHFRGCPLREKYPTHDAETSNTKLAKMYRAALLGIRDKCKGSGALAVQLAIDALAETGEGNDEPAANIDEVTVRAEAHKRARTVAAFGAKLSDGRRSASGRDFEGWLTEVLAMFALDVQRGNYVSGEAAREASSIRAAELARHIVTLAMGQWSDHPPYTDLWLEILENPVQGIQNAFEEWADVWKRQQVDGGRFGYKDNPIVQAWVLMSEVNWDKQSTNWRDLVTEWRDRWMGKNTSFAVAYKVHQASETRDLLEQAWGVIANVGHGNWQPQGPEWIAAAERFRDAWYTSIGIVREHVAHERKEPIRWTPKQLVEAIDRAGFHVAKNMAHPFLGPTEEDQLTLWCKDCGRDSGFHYPSCAVGKKMAEDWDYGVKAEAAYAKKDAKQTTVSFAAETQLEQRIAAEIAAGVCGAEEAWQFPLSVGMGSRTKCAKPQGHEGFHEDKNGAAWGPMPPYAKKPRMQCRYCGSPTAQEECSAYDSGCCMEPYDGPEAPQAKKEPRCGIGGCTLNPGHPGDHGSYLMRDGRDMGPVLRPEAYSKRADPSCPVHGVGMRIGPARIQIGKVGWTTEATCTCEKAAYEQKKIEGFKTVYGKPPTKFDTDLEAHRGWVEAKLKSDHRAGRPWQLADAVWFLLAVAHAPGEPELADLVDQDAGMLIALKGAVAKLEDKLEDLPRRVIQGEVVPDDLHNRIVKLEKLEPMLHDWNVFKRIEALETASGRPMTSSEVKKALGHDGLWPTQTPKEAAKEQCVACGVPHWMHPAAPGEDGSGHGFISEYDVWYLCPIHHVRRPVCCEAARRQEAQIQRDVRAAVHKVADRITAAAEDAHVPEELSNAALLKSASEMLDGVLTDAAGTITYTGGPNVGRTLPTQEAEILASKFISIRDRAWMTKIRREIPFTYDDGQHTRVLFKSWNVHLQRVYLQGLAEEHAYSCGLVCTSLDLPKAGDKPLQAAWVEGNDHRNRMEKEEKKS